MTSLSGHPGRSGAESRDRRQESTKEPIMSRRHRAEKREVIPDAKFGDVVLAKFMNSLMYEGKKSVAEGIIYGAFDTIQAKDQAGSAQRISRSAEQCQPGAGSPVAPRRRRHLSGSGGSAHRPFARARHPLDHHGRAQPQRTDNAGETYRGNLWMPRTIAAPR